MRFLQKHNFNQIEAYQLGWSLIGPPLMTVYCYAVGDVMIDTAQSHMQSEVLDIAIKHKIRKIYLTHYHEDHSGNAAIISERLKAVTYGHTLTARKLSTPFSILPYQKYMWGKALPLKVETFPEKINTSIGEIIPVHTPGHSEDHTSYWVKELGVLFSGDLYLGDRIKYFRSDEDIGLQIDSLVEISKMDFQTLLCSHSPKCKNGKKHIKRKLNFLQDLYGSIIRLWKKGMTDKQIFYSLKLKENYFAKFFCFRDVSMINGVRSAIRHFEKTGK